ncbi:MAG: hypothetical protein AB7F96_17215 [Beijerinckiaceae bacterium]
MAGTVHVLLNPPAFMLAAPPVAEKPAPRWSEIHRPIPIYAFSGGPLDMRTSEYSAQRHSNGARKDTLKFGDMGQVQAGTSSYIQVTLHRMKAGAPAQTAFFVAMARLAADQGLAVTRTIFPNLVPTRFGPAAMADIDVSNGKGAISCLGFRVQIAKPGFEISGIGCGTQRRPVDRRLIACALDRLDLLSSRDDAELRELFVHSEQKRGAYCASGRMASFRKTPGWLENPSPAAAVKALRLTGKPDRLAMR